MLKCLSLFSALVLTMSVSFASKYKVDTANSKAKWEGSKVTGKHSGNVTLKNGTIEMKGKKVVGGEFVMDMSTITVTDLTGEWKKKLEDHLNSADFFNVKEHKTAKFKIKKATAKSGNEYELSGDLTIKGITKPAKLTAKINANAKKVVGTGTLTFDRTDYKIKYGSGKFFQNLGDKMIYDKVTLNLSLTATK